MLLNARSISFVISLVCTVFFVIIFLFLGYNFDNETILLLFFLFLTVFGFTWLMLETLIYSELNKISATLDKLQKKDSEDIDTINFKTKNFPSKKKKKIFQEVYSFVTKKQAEIKELKKLELFRREFIADLSHELKTPIFAAQGYVETLLQGVEDKDIRKKFLSKASKSIDRLNVLVGDLLVLSQLETGEIKMNFENFDLYEKTKDVLEMLENKAEKKMIEMRIADGAPNPIMVHGDAFRIQQVMNNLIENAIKYGIEKGKVLIGFDTADKENVIISVRDDGQGIPPEHLRRIFERFYRVDKSRAKEKGGSGLGLSIVKQIVEAHNSKVMVTSKLGKGSTFAFILKKSVEQ
ncbi:MAG: ATP-binding protein [Cytophagales bacterium]|nr:ATP-binding protein [Cytophagales bacterium]